MSDIKIKGRVRIYACGGAGINIGQLFEEFRGKPGTAFAEVDIVYIDTSRSNLRSSIDPKFCYMLDGLDGSGKIRSENHVAISERVLDILQQFKPADLNIVLHSAAGGSGSVIAPSLVSELLHREIPVIVTAVGSSDARLDAENTLKTLKSYEAIAQRRKAPVVMSYVQNSLSTPRSIADKHIESVIMALCMLYSRENRELDSKDLFNWLRFDRVTSFHPQLVSLTMVQGNNKISDLGNVISVATLVTNDASATLADMPEVQYVGYLPEETQPEVAAKTPIHFVTADGIFPEIVKVLNGTIGSFTETQAARVKKVAILTHADTPTDSGLVL